MDRAKVTTNCRVCLSGQAVIFQTIGGQIYWRCKSCSAVFIDSAHFPDAETEKQRYMLHENSPEDEGYKKYLNRLAKPLLEKITPHSEGLDFGCGPNPVLAGMLKEAGYKMELYDPFFYPDKSVLERKYDFITCTEVVEHLHRPAQEFALLDNLLKPGGVLGIMTCFPPGEKDFAGWHYRQDITHVVFYCEKTFRQIAAKFGWRCEIPARDVVLMHKSTTEP